MLPALHFAPAPGGCELSPLSAGCARSHSLNADLRSLKVAKGLKIILSVPLTPGDRRATAGIASLSPPTLSSAGEVRELHPSAFCTAFFQSPKTEI